LDVLNTKAKGGKRTNNDNVELETSLQQFVLNLLSDGVETDVGLCANFFCHCKTFRGPLE